MFRWLLQLLLEDALLRILYCNKCISKILTDSMKKDTLNLLNFCGNIVLTTVFSHFDAAIFNKISSYTYPMSSNIRFKSFKISCLRLFLEVFRGGLQL